MWENLKLYYNIKYLKSSIYKVKYNRHVQYPKSSNIKYYNLFKIINIKTDQNSSPKTSPAPALCLTKSSYNIIYSCVPHTQSSPNTSK